MQNKEQITAHAGEITTMDKNHKNAKESWMPTSFKMNGKEVRVFGVDHTPATLEYYGQNLEKGVSEASVVVLEVAPAAIGMFNPETLGFLSENILFIGQTLSAAQWQDVLAKNESIHFYHALELLAAQHNKPVAQIHSFPDSDQKILPAAALKASGAAVPNLKIIITALSLIFGGNVKYKGQEASDKNQMQERDMTYSDYYREAVTAIGLDEFLAQEKIKSPVMTVFGSSHVNPLSKYAASPEKTRAKFPNMPKPKIQIFQANPAGLWEQTNQLE